METAKYLIERLLDEMNHNISGGIYNKLQVDFAYNSNHIEGSTLTHEQTRYIYETHSVAGDNINVNDIQETVNHFECFKYVLNTYRDEISEDYIKTLHRMLKSGTLSSMALSAVVGDYKKEPNEVAGIQTALPASVHNSMVNLLNDYKIKQNIDIKDIVHFHSDFELIHPFYDGNGRVGRLLVLKECLKNDIIPIFVNEKEKIFYYQGLHRLQIENNDEQLFSFFLLMQDDMKSIMEYFNINYEIS